MRSFFVLFLLLLVSGAAFLSGLLILDIWHTAKPLDWYLMGWIANGVYMVAFKFAIEKIP